VKEICFFFKDVTKKGFDFFFCVITKKKKDVFASIFFLFSGGNIERWSVLFGVDICCLFFYSHLVFWPFGSLFVMKLSQVYARVPMSRGFKAPRVTSYRLIIFEIFLEQLQNLVFFYIFFVLFLGSIFIIFSFLFLCLESFFEFFFSVYGLLEVCRLYFALF